MNGFGLQALDVGRRVGRTVRLVTLVAALTLVAEAHALSQEPHELVNEVVARVMARLDDDLSNAEDGQKELLSLFEQELSPHFAFDTISRWIAGGRWKTLSDPERVELMAAVRDHIVRVYASLLARGRSVEIRIENNSSIAVRSAKVAGIMATPDGRDFTLEFRLLRGEHDWKLFDLSVDGLSFARSLRAELNPVIAAGGIPALKAYLAEHR